MQHKVTIRGHAYTADETITLADMRSWEPKFFSVRFGKRETFEEHRGFLIVRHTVTFTRCKPERHTVIYGWFRDINGVKPGSLCWGNADNARQARRIIDRILETGEWKKNPMDV